MLITQVLTTNLNAKKYLPGKPIWDGPPTDFIRGQEEENPLLSSLFSHQGIERIFIATDFITVTKRPTAAWLEVDDHVIAALPKNIHTLETLDRPQKPLPEHDTLTQILDSQIRPAIQQDGGDVTLAGFQDGVVYLRLKGACVTCPSKNITIKLGVETLLRQALSTVMRVETI